MEKGTPKGVTGFFHSMRFRVVLLVVIAGCCVCALFFFSSAVYVRQSAISTRTEAIRDSIAKISDRIARNVYTASPSQQPDITRELEFAAAYYRGRVTVTDANLFVIYDSYSLEYDKYIISTEAINALKGISSTTSDPRRKINEIVSPVFESETTSENTSGQNQNKKIMGVMIVNYSIEDCIAMADNYITIGIILSIVALIIGLSIGNFGAGRFVRPLKSISQKLDNVSAGVIDTKIELGVYSEFTKISDSLNDLLGRIEKLEDSRQEFVSNVSHELKTPITSIKVLSDSLIAQPDAPVELYREFMQDINSEIDRESTIINDLLALSKLERKTGEMHIALVNINELLELLLKRLMPIAVAANVELIFESYREVEAEVDEVKLNLALSNIIENAVKYNKEKGSVKVFLNSDHKFFIIRISDTGIGIPQTELENIFDRFYRVDKMRSRQTGGSGLGLAITKSIVLMHHGTVRVESVEGEGSAFTVRIPLNYIPEGSDYLND
ncbi:MAG: HAMP domain-containing histidine kinase [Lachnospiraceae bacterium]|nr:HAMP domain-containing histidine kinase [Lachnospiraceae bacterium]